MVDENHEARSPHRLDVALHRGRYHGRDLRRPRGCGDCRRLENPPLAPALASRIDKTLLLPKIWLRWQINYLKGAPIILAIALYYAWSVGFSVFWDL